VAAAAAVAAAADDSAWKLKEKLVADATQQLTRTHQDFNKEWAAEMDQLLESQRKLNSPAQVIATGISALAKEKVIAVR